MTKPELDDDVALALVVTWAINTVVCDECQAQPGEPCSNGFVHPERVTKAIFVEMTEPLALEHEQEGWA
jgi:hypothetical protein